MKHTTVELTDAQKRAKSDIDQTTTNWMWQRRCHRFKRNVPWHGRKQLRMHTKMRVTHNKAEAFSKTIVALSNVLKLDRSCHEDMMEMTKMEV